MVDLGIDQIITYDIRSGSLEKIHQLSLQPGCGPRHLTFHPDGKHAYLLTELSSEVVVLQFGGSWPFP